VGLIGLLGTLGFDVLLNGVDLRLVGDEALLGLVEPVVNVALDDLVFASIVAHCVVGRLLGETVLVHSDELLDVHQALLIVFKLLGQVVGRWEFVQHFVLHLLDALRVLLQLSLDRALQVLVLKQVLVALLHFDLQLSCGTFSVVQLLLLVIELVTHFVNVFLRR
jgi:hypothetical protein